MTTHFIIEAFGYLGSFLVLVSMLMTSVVKLRIINTIGSVIFTIYAFIIKSYPTAFMNFCLVMINLHFLFRMSKMGKDYEIVECKNDDTLLQYLLRHYKDDIDKIFSGIAIDMDQINKAYVILCQGKPVGISLGKKDGDRLDLKLDYSIPEFRDFSIGRFLFEHLKSNGIRTVSYSGPDENHKAYLDSQDFRKENGIYIKNL